MTGRVLNALVVFLAITTVPVLMGGHEVGRSPQMRALSSAAGSPRQHAAPASIVARSALPACGFAAIES
jgi:hypothetical protein